MTTAPPSVRRAGELLPNGVLGMAFFIMAEAMFFVGLISAFLILRAQAMAWPPPDQPRLPVVVTAFNTALLLASAGTMARAVAEARAAAAGVGRSLLLTGLLGGAFLLLQGFEWVRLIGFGLTTASSLYGATFYVLVGAHGLHVLGAIVALWALRAPLVRAARAGGGEAPMLPMAMYWYFVVAVWPILYVLVYLL